MTNTINLAGTRDLSPPTGVRMDAIDLPQDNADLLPDAKGGQYDNIAKLYMLMSSGTRLDTNSAESQIQRLTEERKEAWDKQIAEMKKALEKREEGSFWGDLAGGLGSVAKVAGVAVSIAAAVASAGAATPIAALAIAGATLSTVGYAQSEFDVLDSMGMSDKMADDWGLGLSVGGGLLSLGAATGQFLSNVPQATSHLTEVANTAQEVSTVAGGAAAVGAGTAKVVQQGIERDAAQHEINATQAMMSAERQQLLLLAIIDSLEDTKERETSNTERITQMNDIQTATITAAAGGAV